MSASKEKYTGTCGMSAAFELRENYGGLVCYIKGKGDMSDYSSPSESPFYEFRDRIILIKFERGITSVGNYAFTECSALKKVQLSQNIEFIGTYAFGLCSSLESVVLNEGVEFIGPKAFEKCDSLTSLSLPSTLKSIDFKCFNHISSKLTVTYNGSREQWKRNVRISSSAQGNRAITEADFVFTDESSQFRRLLKPLADVIGNGGDGKMHVIVPNLTIPGLEKKSGDCTVIVFPDGKTMMIDAGVDDAAEHIVNTLSMLNIKKLDYFVLSHPHRDHFGGAGRVLTNLVRERGGSIGSFIYSGYTGTKKAEANLYDFLRSNCTGEFIKVREGMNMNIGGVDIFVFNPDDEIVTRDGTADGTVNNTSVSLRFTYGQSTYLTAGDLYADREKYLADRFGSRIQSDTMKVNHHAAYTSSTEEWFGAVSPSIVISEEDGSIWSAFDRRLEKLKIKNYKVSEVGLVVLSFGPDRKYRVRTEYSAN